MQPLDWMTLGLLVFAGAQVWVQVRTEALRKRERQLDREERIERAFHYAWAEHFRLESVAEGLDRHDLIELALLDVLRPGDVLPRDVVEFIGALADSSQEAAVLGGIALGACQDVDRQVAIFVNSVHAFAAEAPATVPLSKRPQWVRTAHGADLEPWEKAIRELVRQLSGLMWDAAQHNPRAKIDRTLNFSDDLHSDMSRAAVDGMVRRSGVGAPKGG